ncbi:hypothetical protein LZ554_001697 [Drepanopeziza brunnea f. sp. 'monogermtubi']|nr:hypothetical protein LZ554_001697 [Drepanopeziza brunnea f. sp. 'monogermtubi']
MNTSTGTNPRLITAKVYTVMSVRTEKELTKLGDVVKRVVAVKFDSILGKSHQVRIEHAFATFICDDTRIGDPPTDKLVYVRVCRRCSDAQERRSISAALQRMLERHCGVPSSDLIVTFPGDWRSEWYRENMHWVVQEDDWTRCILI